MRSSGKEISTNNFMSPKKSNQQQPDLICLSHLRWNFVFQRPQHLMSRFAQDRRVFFVEEPVFDANKPELRIATCRQSGVHVVTPHLNPQAGEDRNTALKTL